MQVFGTRLFHLKKDARQAVGLLWTARRRHGAVWLVLLYESLRRVRVLGWSEVRKLKNIAYCTLSTKNNPHFESFTGPSKKKHLIFDGDKKNVISTMSRG